MISNHDRVIHFISTVRDSHPTMVSIFTHGSCLYFYRILKSVFPQAEAYYDMDHVITKIGDRYYDITGEVKKKNHQPLSEFTHKHIKQLL